LNIPPPTPRQAGVIWFSLTTFALALSLALLALLLFGLAKLIQLLSPVIWPLAIGVVIAYLLSPVVNWLSHRGIPRLRAVILVFAVGLVLLLAALGSVVPRAILEARDLASQAPEYAVRMQKRIEQWINRPSSSLLRFIPAEWQRKLEDFRGPRNESGTNSLHREPGSTDGHEANSIHASAPIPQPGPTPRDVGGTNMLTLLPVPPADAPWWVKALDPRALRSVGTWVAAVAPDVFRWGLGQVGRVASWFGLLAGLFLIPVYAFFFLLEEEAISRSWTDYLPVADPRMKAEVVFVLRSINEALIVFFRGQVLVALCDGVVYAVGFLLIGLPYALLVGLMASVVTIVPFLGAALTCGTALIISLVQFGDWQHPLLVLVVFAVVQINEGFVLQPKIIGSRVGLHPLAVIVALMVGTTLLGGVLGGLLAIPLTAALGVLMRRYLWKSPARREAAPPEPQNAA
jgi:predicted PurR-regulated permease PerM